jgi:uncharacterized damage-inducible protein DinB
MTALSAEELLAWVEATSKSWQKLATTHPEILDFPCDIRETANVRELIQHIVAVELRYAQRLHDLPQSSYDEISMKSVDDLYSTHVRAMKLLRELIAHPDYAWEKPIELVTRSMGTLRASPRTILVHCMMHSIRHYAQLATLVRIYGVEPGWQMDYLSMGIIPA